MSIVNAKWQGGQIVLAGPVDWPEGCPLRVEPVDDLSIRVRAETQDRLNAIKQLPRNWDGRNARQIDPGAIRAAERFIRHLPAFVGEAPSVVPMTRGRVQLEWNRGPRALEIEFADAATVHYLRCDDAAHFEDEGTIAVDDESRLADLVRWFLSKD